MWSPVIDVLGSRYRALAPDLIGYGRSTPWPVNRPFDISLDAEIIVQLARLAGAPVHLVGHSYGGAAALEAAQKLPGEVLSLTLIEPVAFHVLPQAGRLAEWDEISVMGNAVRAAVSAGRLRRAAAIFMSYWIGRIRWGLMPRRQKARVVPTMAKVAAEFGGLGRIRTALEDYRRVSAPTLLVTGGRTRRPTRAIVDILGGVLPNSRLRVLPTAGHMSPFTHPDQISRLIVENVGAWD